MLVHFPSALFPMDLACSLAAYITGTEPLLYASFYAMVGGSLLGWLAVISGMLDLGLLVNKKPSSIKKAFVHGTINTSVLIVYTTFTIIAYKQYPHLIKDGVLKLILKTLFVSLMIVGNFIGGNMVLKDKVLDKN